MYRAGANPQSLKVGSGPDLTAGRKGGLQPLAASASIPDRFIHCGHSQPCRSIRSNEFGAAGHALGCVEIDDRVEDAVLQATPRELGEDALNCVEPGAGGPREVEGPARVPRQPAAELWCLVRGDVVEDGLEPPAIGGRDCDGYSAAHTVGRTGNRSGESKIGLFRSDQSTSRLLKNSCSEFDRCRRAALSASLVELTNV